MTTRTRGPASYITDPELSDVDRLLRGVFERAKLDLFSRDDRVRYDAERFFRAMGVEPERVRRAWERSPARVEN